VRESPIFLEGEVPAAGNEVLFSSVSVRRYHIDMMC
jgi:hypothetical protein